MELRPLLGIGLLFETIRLRAQLRLGVFLALWDWIQHDVYQILEMASGRSELLLEVVTQENRYFRSLFQLERFPS